MTLPTAVRQVYSRYFEFSGRSSRPEFWWFALFNVIAGVVLGIIDAQVLGFTMSGPVHPLSNLYGLASFIPGLAVSVRRLHDTDRTGWWLLLGLIPVIGIIVLIVFWTKPGTPGPNRFGDEWLNG
ncbi:DUF805 domain-containing protein [Chachezhania sediminis]|uniref:DUF805 domain-containing protein n=1 Tax=Chachezhania sediminis TaxID=2599291 RepID=UPI00131C822E|nr:DUF805 domain-containing protein [Chachezhania sediminis]